VTPGAVFFASDYGTVDEFVGVVHAVLHRLAPGVPVVDLGHHIAPFDVTAGAGLLVRSAPFLGSGVVLAVVDPGVGTDRRGVALRLADPGSGSDKEKNASRDRPQWLVGPDNGLLTAAAEDLGGARDVFQLDPAGAGWPGPAPMAGTGPTFDGRDVFAPAAAHLVTGGQPDALGPLVDPRSLVGTPAPHAPVLHRSGGGIEAVTVPVTWIDRFGNMQLGLGPDILDSLGVGVGDGARVAVDQAGRPAGADRERSSTGTSSDPGIPVRRVVAFGDLPAGEAGLLVDSSGRVALVVGSASAAGRFGVDRIGAAVTLSADPPTETGAAEGQI
jgi:S-adenosyl-L-methionine hydrolase (adenosine-forming)